MTHWDYSNNMDNTKLTVDQFANIVKQKYPAYKDIDNALLVQKVTEKHPMYKDKIDFGTSTKQVAAPPQVSSTFSQAMGKQPVS